MNFLLFQVILKALGLINFLPVFVDWLKADALLNLTIFLLSLVHPVPDDATDFDFVGNHHESDIQPLSNAL